MVWLAPAAIGLAMLVPIFLWGAIVRETVVSDLAQREADEREVSAQIAAASIDRELRAAEDAITLFISGPTLREALAERDGAVLGQRLGELLQGRAGSLGAVLDPNGTVLAAPLAPQLVGQDFSHRDYFSGALSSAGPYVSEIFSSSTAGSPSVVAVATAVREGPRTLGVAVLTLGPADMLALLEPLRQVEGRDLVITDAQGRVVAATDGSLRPLDESGLPAAGVTPSSTPADVAGRERIVTSAAIAEARWSLHVVDDPSIVLRAQRDLEEQMRLGAGATALLAIVAAAGIGWLYATSLRQRSAIAEREAALARVNAELAEASRHKSEFLSGMSHELRTPLNAILGFSDLLGEQLTSAMSERHRRYLRNIREAGEHLLGLINDVLDLSKVEAGRVELRPELTTLGALLEPVTASASTDAEAHDITFTADAPHDAAVVLDGARTRQILYNLVSNAVKFTPPGGRVRLAARIQGDALALEVQDTGIGIPADRAGRVFGTFERLHEGRSDAPGTGLGLALTKRLVELHGGTIAFESEEGRGTTFRVWLPHVAAIAAAGERVLIVEDEPRDAELIVALVAKAGLASEVVRSAAAARDALRRALPIGVVLDLRLPDARGEVVLEALKGDDATRHVPVVVVTVEDDERRSRVLGADDHLTKPIDHARLSGWLLQLAAQSERKEAPDARAAGG